MAYGRLPGAPASLKGEAVADVEQARERRLTLVVGPTEGGLALWAPDQKASPLSVDFAGGRQGYRLAGERVRHERLIKALGRPRHRPARVLDMTAGLGRDAALMAAAGFAVTLMERQPVLHGLLADGLARAAGSALAANLSLMPVGAAAIALPPGPWHAVYLDPMFPARDKSAAVKRDLQWLQQLCPYPDAEEERALLDLARRQPCDKVIVKRPRRAPDLAGLEPHHRLDGKTVRFDVYLPT